jgi:hypothetical protein
MGTLTIPATPTFPQHKLPHRAKRLTSIYARAWEARQQILDALNSLDPAELDEARALITELQVAFHKRNELRDKISEGFSLGLHPEEFADRPV